MASAAGQPPLVFLGSNHWACLDLALQGSLGSDHGPEGHQGWGPSGLLKLPVQLLPAPTTHQQVYVPFHKEVVPTCPPERLCEDSSWLGLWAGARHPHPHPCSCPARDSWELLSKASSACPHSVLLLQRKTWLSLWAPSWCWPIPASSAGGPPREWLPPTDATSPISHTDPHYCRQMWLSCLHVPLMLGCDCPGMQTMPGDAWPGRVPFPEPPFLHGWLGFAFSLQPWMNPGNCSW